MILAFAEELCWKGDVKRASGKEIVFRVTSIGKIQGYRLDFELRAGYDLWYDPEDDALIEALGAQYPTIDWSGYVFWKRPDHSGIAIIDTESDCEVGHIRVRKRIGGDPVGEIDWTNVVSVPAWRK